MNHTLPRFLLIGSLPTQRRSERRSERGDGLTNAIIGAILTAIFAVAGIGYYINTVASANTTKAETVLQDLGTNITNYYQDNGAFPASTWAQAANVYLTAVPTDPVAPTNLTAFTITAYTSGNASPSYYITDAVVHAKQTLNKLPQWTAAGVAPTQGGCAGQVCSTLVYDPSFGMMAQ